MSEPRPPVELPIEGTSARTVTRVIRAGMASNAITFVFSLLLLPYVLHRVGQDVYGAWLALLTVLAVASFAEGGVRTEVARRVATANGVTDRRGLVIAVHEGTTAVASVTVPVTVALLAFAGQIERLVLPHGSTSSADLVLLLRLLILLLAFQVLAGTHLAVLRGIQRQDLELIGQAISVPVNAAFIVGGIEGGWGIWAFLAGQVGSVVAMLGWQWRGARRLVPELRFRLARPTTTHLRYLTLSGLALVTQIGDVVDSQWDKLVLSHYVGPAAVTSFFVGTSVCLYAKVLAAIPLSPLMVAVAERTGPGHEDPRALQRRLMQLSAILTATVLGGVFAFGPAFIDLWIGPGHANAGLATRWFAVAVVINLLIAPAAFQAYGEGQQRLAALGAVANLLANGILSLVLTIHIGYVGALYGSVLGNLVGAVVFAIAARRRMSYWLWPRLGGPIVATLAVALFVLLGWDSPGNWLGFAASIFAFGIMVLLAAARIERVRLSDLRRHGSFL